MMCRHSSVSAVTMFFKILHSERSKYAEKNLINI